MVNIQQGEFVAYKDSQEKVVKSLQELVNKLSKRVESLENLATTKDSLIQGLEERVKTLENEKQNLNLELNNKVKSAAEEAIKALPKPTTMADIVKLGVGADKSDFEIALVQAHNNELREKKKKERNILIFGLVPKDNVDQDKQCAHDLTKAIGIDDKSIINCIRLKTKSTDKPPPMLVELESSLIKETALTNARKLRDRDEYKDVFIGPDLTLAERTARKRLSDKCKELNGELGDDSTFVYSIRNGVIVNVDKKTKKIVKPFRSSN